MPENWFSGCLLAVFPLSFREDNQLPLENQNKQVRFFCTYHKTRYAHYLMFGDFAPVTRKIFFY